MPLPSLTDMPGAMVAEPGERVLEAMYFDTAGLDLVCAHKAGRPRGAGWTRRLPVAEDSSDEVRASGTNRRRPRAELARLWWTLMLGADLRRVAMMTNHRRWRMLDADGVLRAGVADDRMVARWASGDTPLAWREIEIEVELGERGDGDRRCRPGRAVWGAVQAVGRLVVWGVGKLVACRTARDAAP